MNGAVASGLLVLAAAGVATPHGSRGRLARLGGVPVAGVGALLAPLRVALARAEVSRRFAVGAVALGCGTGAGIGFGPVAAVVAAGYGGLAIHVVLRRRTTAAARRALVAALDGVAALVGDLRAGVTPGSALGAALPLLIGARPRTGGWASVDDLDGHGDRTPRGQVLTRLVAAWRLADQTGAPLADVLERAEAEVRGAERIRALAAAHAASAQATAVLLAALPLAGVALGYGIGADPVAVLFGTPVGGACAIAAVALQLAGLAWARRLAEVPT